MSVGFTAGSAGLKYGRSWPLSKSKTTGIPRRGCCSELKLDARRGRAANVGHYRVGSAKVGQVSLERSGRGVQLLSPLLPYVSVEDIVAGQLEGTDEAF